ncbi:class F sortase [Knoellia sp. LjRoot47]|uniref:class F sortase n=1 Tax=Knoellia sp. LjRoot47 TaxID=3342330 RepID=UPI003ED031B3
MAAAPTGTAGTPTRLRIPDLSIDAQIVTVGVSSTGELDVPERVSTVGWDRYTAAAGAPEGTALIAGHVNGTRGRRGALWNLAAAKPGQTVTLDTATGRTTYRVTAIRQVPKTGLPTDITRADGGHRLVIVTCGGPKRTDGHHRDNVLVYADAID